MVFAVRYIYSIIYRESRVGAEKHSKFGSLTRRREENEPSVCAQRSESGGLRAQLALAVHYTCCLWTCLFVRRLPYQGNLWFVSFLSQIF